MKTAIVYASTHHGNTKKLLDAIAAAYEVDLIDAVKVPEKDLNRYDRIGFCIRYLLFEISSGGIEFCGSQYAPE